MYISVAFSELSCYAEKCHKVRALVWCPATLIIEMSSQVAKDIELDAFQSSVASLNFEPYITAGCVFMLLAPLWYDLGCCSPTVVVTFSTDTIWIIDGLFSPLRQSCSENFWFSWSLLLLCTHVTSKCQGPMVHQCFTKLATRCKKIQVRPPS